MSFLCFLLTYMILGYLSVLLQGYAARCILNSGATPVKLTGWHLLMWPIPTIGALYTIGKYPKAAVK